MSNETATALAALAIAIVAMLIAMAQALQQYFITGQLIRLCDSVVFGGLPGQGERVWQAAQFRFRVVYKIPQFGLSPELWPSSALPSFAKADGSLLTLTKDLRRINSSKVDSQRWTSGRLPMTLQDLPHRKSSRSAPEKSTSEVAAGHVGEASWASFVRVVSPSCHASMLFCFAYGDADRCPADLPSVPMQVSLRDIVVIALSIGMECTSASFEAGSVTMSGVAGTITSSKHPILGPMIHFAPRCSDKIDGITSDGQIHKAWAWRIMDNCIVAGRHYPSRLRRFVEQEIGRFEVNYRVHTQNVRSLNLHGQHAWSSSARRSVQQQANASSRNPTTQLDPHVPLRSSRKDGKWIMENANVPSVPSCSRQIYGEPPRPDFVAFKAAGNVGHYPSRSHYYSSYPREHLSLGELGSEHEVLVSRNSNTPDTDDERRIRMYKVDRGRKELVAWAEKSKTSECGSSAHEWNTMRDYVSLDVLEAAQIDFYYNRNDESIHIKSRLSGSAIHDLLRESQFHRENRGHSRESNQYKELRLLSWVENSATQGDAANPASSANERNDNRAQNGPQEPIQPIPRDSNCDEADSQGGHCRFGRKVTVEDVTDSSSIRSVAYSVNSEQNNSGDAESCKGREPKSCGQSEMAGRGGNYGSTCLSVSRQNSRALADQAKSHQLIKKWNLLDLPPGSTTERCEEKSTTPAPQPSADGTLPHDKRDAQESDAQGSGQRKSQTVNTTRVLRGRTGGLARNAARRDKQYSHLQTAGQFGNISWFWLSQTDVIPGFWATPWKSLPSLNHQLCVGAVTVLLEAIIKLVGDHGVRFVNYTYPPCDTIVETIAWMRRGECTFPAYAYNGQGGVVCSGTYVSMSHPQFAQNIPVLDLMESYLYQIDRAPQILQETCEMRLVELMRLDAWLSLVGRTPEICGDTSALLIQTPALVQYLMDDFELEFLSVDLSSYDGGAQTNGSIADWILDTLDDLRLTDREALYALVATLRAVKVGQCILFGSDTSMLADILEKDVQVSLV